MLQGFTWRISLLTAIGLSDLMTVSSNLTGNITVLLRTIILCHEAKAIFDNFLNSFWIISLFISFDPICRHSFIFSLNQYCQYNWHITMHHLETGKKKKKRASTIHTSLLSSYVLE